MKVLFDHPIFQMQRFGGISRYFHELIRHLVLLPEVEAHAFLGFHVNGYGTDRIPGLASATGWPRPSLRGLDRLLDPLADRWLEMAHDLSRFDVLHRTYYDPRDLARGRCRTVLTVYDMIHELHPRDARQRAWMEARKRPAVAHAEAVIAISESTKQDLIRLYGTPASRIHVIPLASSLSGPGARESPIERPFLLFVGGRGGYKNFDLLARAFAAHPGWGRELDVVCFGGGAFAPAEHQRLTELGIDARVRHLEGPDALLETLYRHARMLVYPSRYEGFGLPPLEAMQLGCPVVVARTSSLPEVVGEAAEFVEPDSLESLEAAIERVLQDTSHREELVRRGHARAQEFSWARCAEQTLAVYRHVAG